ncbi:MAG: hypothetical protein WCI73_11170 [Phycisphaerae bacterium]
MKFRVQGASKTNGDEVDFEILAVDSKAAEKIAHDRGVMVSAITAEPDEVNLAPIEMDFDEPSPAPGLAKPVAAAASAAPAGAPAAHDIAHAEAHAGDPEHPSTHMEYKLMQNQALYLLEKSVNKMILAGWEPQGGLTISIQNNAPNYFQALVRRPKPTT